jgi:processing peptidase subunit beta
LGPSENIQSITRDDILDYVRTHYTGPRIVIAGAGAVDHKQLVSLSEKLFSNIPRHPPNGKKVLLSPSRFTGSDIRVRDDRHEYCHMAYAFPIAGWTDPDNFPLMTIQTLLGSWDKGSAGGIHASSDMISAIVEEDLAISVNTFNTQYSDTGLFGVYAVSEPIGPQDLMYNITKAITGLCYTVDENKVKEAKNQLKMTMLQSLDGSTQVAEEIGRQLLTYGRRIHPMETLQRIDAVDTASIKAAANRYFYDRDFAFACIGNTHEVPDYNWLRRRTYYLKY